MQRFIYRAQDEDLKNLNDRLRNTRLPSRQTTFDWSEGVPLEKLKELIQYWENEYDWRKIEGRLAEVDQFRTNIDGLHFHFLHIRSSHANALPMIMTHGWPSTILGFHRVWEPLTEPEKFGGNKNDAFDLIIPSLPGFALSDKPAERGWNADRTARAWATLMQRLGYSHYVAQGGDWGSFVTTRLAQQRAPGLLAIHLTMPQVTPTQMPDTLTAEEQRTMDGMKYFRDKNFGYHLEQSTKPQTIGYALSDSPAGLAAWIADIYWNTAPDGRLSDHGVPLEDMLNEITLYWLTNSAATSARFYFEQNEMGPRANLGTVELPVACTIFPGDLHAPRTWAERLFPNLVYWSEPDRGGHFAPLEQPEIFVSELRNAFRTVR